MTGVVPYGSNLHLRYCKSVGFVDKGVHRSALLFCAAIMTKHSG